ncbi:MAG TPA: hypothetical protein VGM56_12185 [Byssovorax sp.]
MKRKREGRPPRSRGEIFGKAIGPLARRIAYEWARDGTDLADQVLMFFDPTDAGAMKWAEALKAIHEPALGDAPVRLYQMSTNGPGLRRAGFSHELDKPLPADVIRCILVLGDKDHGLWEESVHNVLPEEVEPWPRRQPLDAVCGDIFDGTATNTFCLGCEGLPFIDAVRGPGPSAELTGASVREQASIAVGLYPWLFVLFDAKLPRAFTAPDLCDWDLRHRAPADYTYYPLYVEPAGQEAIARRLTDRFAGRDTYRMFVGFGRSAMWLGSPEGSKLTSIIVARWPLRPRPRVRGQS